MRARHAENASFDVRINLPCNDLRTTKSKTSSKPTFLCPHGTGGVLSLRIVRIALCKSLFKDVIPCKVHKTHIPLRTLQNGRDGSLRGRTAGFLRRIHAIVVAAFPSTADQSEGIRRKSPQNPLSLPDPPFRGKLQFRFSSLLLHANRFQRSNAQRSAKPTFNPKESAPKMSCAALRLDLRARRSRCKRLA